MAKKSKKSVEATEREDEGGEESEEDEKPAKKSKKKTSKKTAKSDGGEKRNGNVVTLKQLAADAEVTPQVARQKLRAAGIEREDGSRWQWEKGSKALKKAQDALGGE